MYRRFFSLALPILACVLSFGCVSAPIEYAPKTPQERQMMAFLDTFQDAWNSKDEAGFLIMWHDDSKIMYGDERTTVTKAEFVDILPKRMEISPVMKLKVSDIRRRGSKATVKVSNQPTPEDSIDMTIYMLREKGIWYITSWEY